MIRFSKHNNPLANIAFKKPLPPQVFAGGCLAVLLITSALWALWGANLQSNNADQLVNSYLFKDADTFRQATLPGQHSFLLKWPLLYLVKLLGNTPAAFTAITVLLVLVTVGGFALVLYRIEKRPLYFGSLCLALASVLLLVPAVPYTGGLLPVNMAMLTTRNLEYLVYLVSLLLFIRAERFKSRSFWIAVGTLGVLIASDKMFLSMAVGSALVGLVGYALVKGWNMVNFSAGWLVDSLLASLAGSILLAIVSAFGVTTIAGSSTATPYALVSSFSGLISGLVFGCLGLLTNLGANPAFDANTLQAVLHGTIDKLVSFSGPGYVVNLGLAVAGAVAITKIVQHSIAYNRDKLISMEDRPTRLSIMLILSSLSMGASFVLTDHYYPVDARYLSIALFAVFVCLATYGRKLTLPPRRMFQASGLMLVVIFLSCIGAWRTARAQQKPLEPFNTRNQTVVELMRARKTTVLVGDYWRVLPAQQASGQQLIVTPLANCTTPRDVLSSKAWQPDLTKTGFAYLLSLDRNLTNSPRCNLEEITQLFGKPNKSSLVAGTNDAPLELLLFYDSGIHKSSPVRTPAVSTVFTVDVSDLPTQLCDGPTIMQTVAHQDDDLLFMNPDLIHDIQAGRCVRTIYLTAGDAGGSPYYWLDREKGAEQAYSSMLKTDTVWVERTIRLNSGQFVTFANPRGNRKIQLVFMHLPDGNLTGKGFAGSQYASLEKLHTGAIQRIASVDKQSSYSQTELIDSLSQLFELFRPTAIRSLSSLDPSNKRHEHSDHMAVGALTQLAYQAFEKRVYQNAVMIPISYYMGYPVASQPPNVAGSDLSTKDKAFAAYAKHDPAACASHQSCWAHSNYQQYLPKQYQTSK